MKDNRRFQLTKSPTGMFFIRDSQKEKLVAVIHRSGRPDGQTEAMAKVMLDALNNAVERKNGL